MAPGNSGSKQSKIGSFFKASDGSKATKPAPKQQTTLSFATKSKAKSADEDTDEVTDDGRETRVVQESSSSEGDTKKKRRRPRKSTEATTEETASNVKKEDEDGDVDDEPVTKKPRRQRRVIEDDDEDAVMENATGGTKELDGDSNNAAPDDKKTPSRTIKKSESPKSSSLARTKRQATSSSPLGDNKEEITSPAPAEDDTEELTKDDDVIDTSEESDAESVSSASEDEKPSIKAAKTETKAKAKTKAKAQKKLVKEIDSKDPYPDWKAGDPAPYAALVTTFSIIELTTKRLEIMAHCSKLLRQIMRLTPGDLLSTILLMINKLAPDYAGIELGIGESLIMKAIGEVTGRSLQVIKQDQKDVGDLGLVAVKSKSTQKTMYKPKPLTIQGVHKGLMDIATTSGNGAQQRKVDGIKKLLASADVNSPGRVDITKDKGGPSEAKFIVRFLEGKLRLGLAERTVLSSLAHAVVLHEAASSGKEPTPAEFQQGEGTLKAVYSELPSYDVIIPAMLENGLSRLRETCKLRPGVPLKPMLAKPTKAITEVLDRFENQTFTCEYKYDGERAQIHYVAKDDQASDAAGVGSLLQPHGNGVACIFSRNSEDLSKKYPDVLARLHTWVREDTTSFVLDCETVAWDVTEKKVLPFQQLMTRKRKDVKIEDVKVKVCVFAFDLLYLNGEAIVERPLRERRELLHKAFAAVQGEFVFATHMNSQELDDIQTFLDESVKASCEGLMVKMLDGAESGYEPSKRSCNWLKIKKDYLSGVGDSLDLVVIGAYHGKGKRTSVYGAFLLACWNPKAEKYETICNIGTGFSEQVLETLHANLSQHVIDRPKPFYAHSAGGQHQPDVWFEPRQVWEVRTADLTLSPRYKAGHGEGVDTSGEDRGISLRFPRFIKVRDDKKPDEATSSRQVAEMYRKQESVSKTKGVDDDFEY